MAADFTEFPIETKKVSELAATGTLDGTETFNAVQSSTSKSITLQAIEAYILTAGHYYMTGNATETVISVQGTYVKVAGTTLSGTIVERFDVTTTDNKAVHTGALEQKFKINASISFIGTNGNDISFRIAKNGTTIPSSQVTRTVSATGDVATLTIQDLQNLDVNDYIEIFVANDSGTNNVTINDLNVIVVRA